MGGLSKWGKDKNANIEWRASQELGALLHNNTGVMFLSSIDSLSLMLTGEIQRKTSFEKGFPFQYVENQSGNEIKLVPNPLVKTIKQS